MSFQNRYGAGRDLGRRDICRLLLSGRKFGFTSL
jgi:hypothetical protein